MDARELTADRLREVLHYCPETGVFTWIKKTGRKVVVGSEAGTLCHGYIAIRIDGRRYLAHRLAWLWMKGEWPALHIDHRDTCPTNNHWLNLREATHQLNMQNMRRAPRNSSTGVLGVTQIGHKFMAQIAVNRRRIYLGMHTSAEEAHAAYLSAKRRLHEGCTL